MRFHPGRLLDKLNATYWFVPSCMVVLAIGLSFLMPWLDQRYDIGPSTSLGWIGQTQTDGARAVLVAVAGSIIGVTGTTFSITIVAVSFASANFGPRLIANFMRDRGNQLTLGTFIATFVYCLLVLRRVHGAGGEEGADAFDAFVPHLSVIVALLLALASVGVLIYFIHHVPETINIDRLVAGIGRELKASVTALFPDVETVAGRSAAGAAQDWKTRAGVRASVAVRARKSGYLQGVDMRRLGRLAEAHLIMLRVQYRPGDFVVEGDVLLELRTHAPSAGGAPEADDARADLPERLLACFETGHQRSAHQDCLFLADQLVEVIGRAMSPGINDPFTAITCLSWLKGALIEFVERDSPVFDPQASVAVLALPIDFERLVAVAFDQTRQYICGDRNVALHAMSALAEIAVRVPRAEHRAALRRRMDELRAASEAALAPALGADEVGRRHDEAVRLLADPEVRERRRGEPGWFEGSG